MQMTPCALHVLPSGIMLVGPSGGGKSAIEECLAGALTELGTKHVIWRMNPKVGTALFFKLMCWLLTWPTGYPCQQ
jgi:ABC-type nitrate/sulfonate/bicarbonate transport system ATPase subunit